MAAGLKTIKSKIKSVGNIKKITRTMEMISVSKMKKAVQQTLAVRPYGLEALQIIQSISKEVIDNHPLFMVPEHATRTLVVLVASNKGLCGSYNTNVARALNSFLQSNSKDTLDVVTIGKFSEKIARRLKLNIVASFVDLENYVSVDDTRALSNYILEQFSAGNYARIYALFTNYVKASVYKPTVRQLLPVIPDMVRNILEDIEEGSNEIESELQKPRPLYVFEPNAEHIVSVVVPQLLHVVCHQVLTESHASEHSARMFAMKQATDAATDMLKGLKLQYNRIRQDAVTQEIAEISSGAVALAVS